VKTAPSGDFYDWKQTLKPERPWMHAYHQTFVDKLFLARKGNPRTGKPPEVYFTFAQALERMRRVDQITRGIAKITYLVGWQFDGHDSRYPDWSEVNPRLKRPEDDCAADSLKWLLQEARRCNTTASLHINMLDAYENAPSWPAYLAQDVLAKRNGALYKGLYSVFEGEQAYWIDQVKEWETGLAQKRILGLLEMLPIREQGTIHIDAFSVPSNMDPNIEEAEKYKPDHIDIEEQRRAMRRVLRFWRDHGVDVTSECMFHGRRGDGFFGLQPMAWVINMTSWGYPPERPEISEEAWYRIPPELFCVCTDSHALASGQLLGTSMQGESLGGNVAGFKRPFCLQTLPWYFLNRLQRLRMERGSSVRTLHLSDGVISQVDHGHRTITRHGRVLLDGEDVCMPALWRPNPELMAYSLTGYAARTWAVPESWADVRLADLYEITPLGLAALGSTPVAAGQLTLSLAADQAVAIVPHGTRMQELNQGGMPSRQLADQVAGGL
jgi:hypothetical protein